MSDRTVLADVIRWDALGNIVCKGTAEGEQTYVSDYITLLMEGCEAGDKLSVEYFIALSANHPLVGVDLGT